MGWALAENGQVGFILREKFAWSAHIESFMTITGPIGVAIGSQIGGKFANRLGIRRVMIWSNIVAIVSGTLKIQTIQISLFVGRILYGICCGIQTLCLSQALNDNVPAEVIQYYGVLVNAGICMGIFASNFLAIIVPLEEVSNPESLEIMR